VNEFYLNETYSEPKIDIESHNAESFLQIRVINVKISQVLKIP